MSMQFIPLLKAKIPPKNLMLIGQCIAHEIPKEANVQVKVQEFDSYLNMYFCKYDHFIAYDPDEICKHGDVVLISKLIEKRKTHISHTIQKIIYPYGDVTDPISGKKCVGPIYREAMKLKKELFGVAKDGTGGFDYDSAPDRGWQEGRKDFTYRVGYKKFHEFPPGHKKHDDKGAV